MKNIGMAIATLVLAVPGMAGAQEPSDQTAAEPAIEVTPHVSLGSAASSGFGAAIRFPLSSQFSVELETGQSRAERNALTMNLSLLYDLPAIGRVTPYLAGGAGLEQSAYAVGSPEGGLVVRAKTIFALNAGGGVRVPVNDTCGVRSDARWFQGAGREAPDRWRIYNGVTFGTGRK
jgi:opacity protein-like surface antigen